MLLNRRGWSNFLTCRSCGRVWECPRCDVTLVLHRAAGRVSCHHCGHSERVPGACPDCASVTLARHGVGTEQLGAELERLMDPLPVFRLDADTVAGEGVGPSLERFDAADSGVLVGTQMVAKGHDFPDVTLGVVLDADATLRFPDFRAEERTFALVAQLAGRSGRGPRGGRVVVQALEPDARALRHAALHDADGFLEGELGRREALGYPPHGHLIRVVCASREQGPEAEAAAAVRELAELYGAPVLGPAPLFRRKGWERAQLVVKSAGARAGDRGRQEGGRGGLIRPRPRGRDLRGRRRPPVGRSPAAPPGSGPRAAPPTTGSWRPCSHERPGRPAGDRRCPGAGSHRPGSARSRYTTPPPPAVTSSGGAPRSCTIAGVPTAAASATTYPNVS